MKLGHPYIGECQGKKYLYTMSLQLYLCLLECHSCGDDVIDQDRLDPFFACVSEVPGIFQPEL